MGMTFEMCHRKQPAVSQVKEHKHGSRRAAFATDPNPDHGIHTAGCQAKLVVLVPVNAHGLKFVGFGNRECRAAVPRVPDPEALVAGNARQLVGLVGVRGDPVHAISVPLKAADGGLPDRGVQPQAVVPAARDETRLILRQPVDAVDLGGVRLELLEDAAGGVGSRLPEEACVQRTQPATYPEARRRHR